MSKTVKLKNGDSIDVRAKCANPKCGLLLLGITGNLTSSKNEETIRPEMISNQADLLSIPQVVCVHCQ
ncbi:hypothetical protein K8R61_00760 [bacterium]|nr:hypothetical protein [bacterium]